MITIYIILCSFLNSFEIVEVSNNVSVCENEFAQIYVLADSDNLQYQWFKDGIELLDQKNSSVVFEKLTFENSGRYFCRVTDLLNVSKESKEILVNSKSKTNIINKTNNISSFEGQTLRLKCDINDVSEQIIDAKWYDNKWNLINNDDRFSGANSNLLSIKDLTISDSIYYCVIEGDCGKDTASYSIDFYNIKAPFKYLTTICENHEFEYKFTIEEINKKSLPSNFNISLRNTNGEDINYISQYLDNKIEITIKEVMTNKLTGKYFCEITFAGRTFKYEVADLSIYNDTKLVNKSNDFISLKEGSDLTLIFSATGNIQRYVWYKDGILLDTTKTTYYNKKQVLKEDSGIYTCLVKNFCKDTTYFISEVEVTENAMPLSVELLNNLDNIEYIVDCYGSIVLSKDYNSLRNGLYIVKFKDKKYKKYFKHE